MSDTSGTGNRSHNIVVIIAHGVGEADPGYAATTLGATLGKCAGFRSDGAAQVRYLPDVNLPERQLERTFPVFIGSGQLTNGDRMTFAELYWADVAKIGPGRINTILGLFRVIFESHHLIDGMLNRNNGLGVRLLRHLLLIASWMLRGPIIGLVVNTSALFWAALYILPKRAEWLGEPILFALVSVTVFLVSLSLLIWAARRRDATWYDPTSWTALFAVILFGAFLAVRYWNFSLVDCPPASSEPTDCGQSYVDAVYKVLHYFWGFWGAMILLCFALAGSLALAWRRRGTWNDSPPIFTALGVVLLQFVLWTAILGTAVMPFLYRAEEVKGITALKKAIPSAEAVTDTYAKRLLNVTTWDPERSRWIDRVAFGYGFNGVMIAAILAAGALTHLRRNRLARRSISDPTIDARKMPRIVVGPWILGILLLMTFCQAVYLLVSVQIWEGVFISPLADAVQSFVLNIVSGWKHTVLAVGWLSTLTLPFLAGAALSNPIHIVRDLIDYQYSRRRASILTRLRSSRDPEHWPRRARIHARLLRLLDELVRNTRADHVIFAVHSQGSVIAFDYLREASPANHELGGLRPDLVSFGSPLTHLYEHYFFEYADLKGYVQRLHDGIGRWINLYRIDDYIGTQIGDDWEMGIENRQIGLGGHTDYWKEEILGQTILDLLAGRAAERRSSGAVSSS
jgi:protein-S-isoprenylcysteine O-methyltransferase Ste14